jgi:hypothetical protein
MGSKVGNFCVTLNFMSTEFFYFLHYHSIFYKMDKIRGVAQWKRVGPITQVSLRFPISNLDCSNFSLTFILILLIKKRGRLIETALREPFTFLLFFCSPVRAVAHASQLSLRQFLG